VHEAARTNHSGKLRYEIITCDLHPALCSECIARRKALSQTTRLDFSNRSIDIFEPKAVYRIGFFAWVGFFLSQYLTVFGLV